MILCWWKHIINAMLIVINVRHMGITKDIYDRKYKQLVQRRIEINELLEQHHEGNENFKVAATALVTLASKASDIFDCSTTEEKRQLISYVFSNLELEGSKLVYALKTPFNLFVDIGKCKKWLPEQDSNLRQID